MIAIAFLQRWSLSIAVPPRGERVKVGNFLGDKLPFFPQLQLQFGDRLMRKIIAVKPSCEKRSKFSFNHSRSPSSSSQKAIVIPSPAQQQPSLNEIYQILHDKTFVDLTHAFEPGIPHWKGFPNEERETIYWYDPGVGTLGTGFLPTAIPW
jgi:hypothetical protein